MKRQMLTSKEIGRFDTFLQEEEKSKNTREKYVRDAIFMRSEGTI